ncbi:type IV secretory system conjugative DNA transfer family protein [Burkholderia multivorans]|uniref:type IV secretory system conjugative DNA transfer family protein n=1 Tax=Burkholderia multivorans TaxID=87883 RepID=UPI001C238ACC|nr:type IV secretion system DNA-binding domain-containing protein [Burkholderia multivorans]
MKIYKFRSRKTDYNLKPWDYRTYQGEYVGLFLLIFFVMVVFFNWTSTHLGGVSLYERLKDGELQKILEVIFSSSLVAIFSSIKLVKPVQLTKISDVSEHFYYSDSKVANDEFHKDQQKKYVIDFKNQPKNSLFIVRPEDCKDKEDFYKPIQFNDNASILSWLIIGIAGSGKSVLLNRMYQEILSNGHKLIVHAPDSKARDMIVSSGYPCYVSAPWTTSSIYIDLAKTLDVDDMNLKNGLIDLVITSFFGYVDPNSSDAFFQNGAKFILTASLKKLCHKMPGQWTLEDWKNELISKSEIWQFKDLVDTYMPEAGFTISEDAEKMTASIIASIVPTLVSIGRLSNYYKQCRKAIDIRKWCLDQDKKQAIILCSDPQYEEVSKISIALFVNLITKFLLSSDREKVFNKNGVRVYQALDEYPNFGRNIDNNAWVTIINEGRKFGNSAIIVVQNTLQMVSIMKSQNAKHDAQKFIGSFHNQIMCQPSSEDGDHINKIVGEITWDDKEAQQTTDQSTGKTSVSYQHKARKEQIGFKRLQNDLGFEITTNSDGSKQKHGLNVAVRLFESKVTAKLFIPFLNEFAKPYRDKFRDKIVNRDGKEFIKQGSKLTPLFYDEKVISITKRQEEYDYTERELKIKMDRLAKIDKDNIKEREKLEYEIEELQQLKLELGEEYLLEEGDSLTESLGDIALHNIDHTGLTSTLVQGLEIADSLTTQEFGKGEINVNMAGEEEVRKPSLFKKKKQYEMGD